MDWEWILILVVISIISSLISKRQEKAAKKKAEEERSKKRPAVQQQRERQPVERMPYPPRTGGQPADAPPAGEARPEVKVPPIPQVTSPQKKRQQTARSFFDGLEKELRSAEEKRREFEERSRSEYEQESKRELQKEKQGRQPAQHDAYETDEHRRSRTRAARKMRAVSGGRRRRSSREEFRFEGTNMRRAVILSEILNRPVAFRRDHAPGTVPAAHE